MSIRMKVQHSAGSELDGSDEDFTLSDGGGEEEDEKESYEAFEAMRARKRKGGDDGGLVDDLEDWGEEDRDEEEEMYPGTEGTNKKKKKKKPKTGPKAGGNPLSISISKKDIAAASETGNQGGTKQDKGRNALFKKLGGWN
ncbi:hypothetical protein TrRE_jg11983 [Triparma retinervis]|uniref:Uncharacterized protein n=1 Tax=Triparma retinervis TaxID=2557542 RepID=A0A9W7FWS9_9STRA|nr:hypothetical protein TrRE_jg11983 [Triparma retinervis]